MFRKFISFVLIAGLAAGPALAAKKKKKKKDGWENKKGVYAVFETSMGKIVCSLYEKETPKTVENFIGLATGEKEWVDPENGKKVKKKFYDGRIFHRVIPKFMIQTGCPLGNGRGGPGYRFEDEIVQDLKFDRPGLLAMANSGPNSNGSQIFITEVATPWLSGRHTIFGSVVEGQGIANKIARVPATQTKPNEDVIIKKLTIKRVGKDSNKKKKKAKKKAKLKLSGKKVLFVVAPRNFRDEEYFEPKKLLEDEGAEIVTTSVAQGDLIGMLGGRTKSDVNLNNVNANDYDAVVFVGGPGAQVFWNNSVAHDIVKNLHSNGKIVAAICMAPVTLAKAGILKNKKATCFQGAKGEMLAGGANFTGLPVEQDGNIITGSGPESSKDFAYRLLDMLAR